ncbi:expressed unknown protein [Seminavis robusta]|uniref:Uncharacterized protein n=1 Tax=Seminavis robusta TaxID=568900 RepID=A0A9N8F0Z9_9STRA|nr:expressed unknown protein [Seminavis robusta]|eukprot:Sro2435_g327580.1 n/a (359) ;mRNA; f:12357-13433
MMEEAQGMIRNSQFTVEFSTWPPNLDFRNLQERVLITLETIFCQEGKEEEENEQGVCLLKNHIVEMGDGERSLQAEDTVLFMAVKDFEEDYDYSTYSDPLSWSAWSISFLVVRMGSSIIEKVVESDMVNTTEVELSAESIYDAGMDFLEASMTFEVNKNILEGTFDQLMNQRTAMGTRVVTSIPGEEQETFHQLQYPFMSESSSTNSPAGTKGEEDASSDEMMYIIIFFAGLGAGLIVIVVLLIITCSRRCKANEDSSENHVKSMGDSTDKDISISQSGSVERIIVLDTSSGSIDQNDPLRRSLENQVMSQAEEELASPMGRHRRSDSGSIADSVSMMTESVASRVDWSVAGQTVAWA